MAVRVPIFSRKPTRGQKTTNQTFHFVGKDEPALHATGSGLLWLDRTGAQGIVKLWKGETPGSQKHGMKEGSG